MHVTRKNQAKPYAAAKHHGMSAFRLQGLDASPAERLWVGLSQFLPGGGAESAASPSEKVYIVLEGEITVTTKAGAVTLQAMDSILIEANEERTVENRSVDVARMLVVSPR